MLTLCNTYLKMIFVASDLTVQVRFLEYQAIIDFWDHASAS